MSSMSTAPAASTASTGPATAASSNARSRASGGKPAGGFSSLLQSLQDTGPATAGTDGLKAKAGPAGKRGSKPGEADAPTDAAAWAAVPSSPHDASTPTGKASLPANQPPDTPLTSAGADKAADAQSPGKTLAQTPAAPAGAKETPAPAAEPANANKAQEGTATDAGKPGHTDGISTPRLLTPPAQPATPDAGQGYPANRPTSDGEADAVLAAAEARVEAFSNGLKLARQHHQKDIRQASLALNLAQGPRASAANANAAARHGAASETDLASGTADVTAPAANTLNAGLPLQDAAQAAASPSQADRGQDRNLGSSPSQEPASTAGVARQPALSPEVGSSNWGLALSQHMVRMVNASQQSAEMQLNPAALGPLKVTLTMGERQLEAQFSCAHDDVSAAIEAALPQLRSALAAQGVALGPASVDQSQAATPQPSFNTFTASQQDSAGSNNPNSSGSARSQGGSGGQPARPAGSPAEQAFRPGPARSAAGSGRLDAYA